MNEETYKLVLDQQNTLEYWLAETSLKLDWQIALTILETFARNKRRIPLIRPVIMNDKTE